MRFPKDVTLVTPTTEDAEAIAEIIRAAYSNIPDSQTPADMPIYHAEYHAETMKEPDLRWRLLCDSEGPAGVAMWRLLPKLAHLRLLFVRGDRQGRGYGSLLLKHFQESSQDEQPDTRLLTLHCLAGASRSLRFYRRHGYSEYQAGLEGKIPDLHLWIDVAKKEDTSWLPKKDMVLFFKLIHRR